MRRKKNGVLAAMVGADAVIEQIAEQAGSISAAYGDLTWLVIDMAISDYRSFTRSVERLQLARRQREGAGRG